MWVGPQPALAGLASCQSPMAEPLAPAPVFTYGTRERCRAMEPLTLTPARGQRPLMARLRLIGCSLSAALSALGRSVPCSATLHQPTWAVSMPTFREERRLLA